MSSIVCNVCGETKPEGMFWRTLTGYEKTCKACRCVRRYNTRLEKRVAAGLPVRRLTARQITELRAAGLRYCPGCVRVLPLLSFSHCRGGRNNAPHCLECTADFASELRSRPGHKEARMANYRIRRVEQRDRHLVKKYGVTLAAYQDLLAKQGGVCAVCGKTPEDNKKALSVDHCHSSGKVRGLLCNNCNVAVGFIQDNPSIALRINEYLTTEVSYQLHENIQPLSTAGCPAV